MISRRTIPICFSNADGVSSRMSSGMGVGYMESYMMLLIQRMTCCRRSRYLRLARARGPRSRTFSCICNYARLCSHCSNFLESIFNVSVFDVSFKNKPLRLVGKQYMSNTEWMFTRTAVAKDEGGVGNTFCAESKYCSTVPNSKPITSCCR